MEEKLKEKKSQDYFILYLSKVPEVTWYDRKRAKSTANITIKTNSLLDIEMILNNKSLTKRYPHYSCWNLRFEENIYSSKKPLYK